MTLSNDDRPDPGDPDFFARFTLSDDILDAAFGPVGGTPAPRVVHRPSADDSSERADSTRRHEP